jgi:hypothetical protein
MAVSMAKEHEMKGGEERNEAAAADASRRRERLSPEARRALAEAEARRRNYLAKEAENPPERGGRGGKDPARYGDWEIKGRAIDF